MIAALALVLALLLSAPAWALPDCSQTVGITAAAVAFPASGKTGPTRPSVYLEICNAHASNTLGVNWVDGTASIGAQGTLTLNPGGCKWWDALAIPAAVSVIGSAGGTPTACGYQ